MITNVSSCTVSKKDYLRELPSEPQTKIQYLIPNSGMDIAFQMLYRFQVREDSFCHQVINGYDAA